jgi:hypothetical protein
MTKDFSWIFWRIGWLKNSVEGNIFKQDANWIHRTGHIWVVLFCKLVFKIY